MVSIDDPPPATTIWLNINKQQLLTSFVLIIESNSIQFERCMFSVIVYDEFELFCHH